jgi:hypothetical protein
MIKWFFTTILLMITVAVVTIIMLSPSLKSKAEHWLKAKTELARKKTSDVKETVTDKDKLEHAVKKGAKELGPLVKEGKQKLDPLIDEGVSKLKGSADGDSPPSTTNQAGAKSGAAKTDVKKPVKDDGISDQDKKKLEQVLEKKTK